MITKKQVISCISKALKVPNSKININLSDKNFENWDSLGHLEILMNLDKALKGKAIKIEDLAQAYSVKKIFTVLKKNKLLN
jgi:acyl carrier protein|tara:strand:+ start:6848 stop:7090 length:243 start_codon:yes stop_codon:yes gene_type:complete